MKKQLARLACLSLLAAACSAEHPLATGDPATDRMSVIPNVKGQWTYFSMVTHTVVGTCAVTDTLAQQAYAARTDWDIALCGELIRTNGGTSGNGQGAVQRVQNKSFNALDQAPADGYTTDTDDIVIRR